MLNLAFLLLFFFTPLMTWYLLRIAGDRINQISALNITTLSIYTFSVIGLFPLFYKMDAYRVAIGITNANLVFVVLLCSTISIFMFLLGAIFVRRVLHWTPYPVLSRKIQPLKQLNHFGPLVFFSIVIVTFLLYLSKIDQIAILVALKEGPEAAVLARSNMGNNFDKLHRYSLILNNLGTLVTLAFFSLWLMKKKFIRFMLFLISFSLSGAVAVMATEKAPFINLLMALFITYYLVKKDGFIPKRHVIIFVLISFLALILFYIYFMGSRDIYSATMSILSRTFSGSIAPAYFYLEYVPHIKDYYWFRTFPNPGGILPFEPVRYTVDIMNHTLPQNLEQGIIGSMPTVFWGEAYLNFGFFGIPIISFIMGCFVATISHLISRIQPNSVSIAFTVWMIFHLKSLSITGFSNYLYDFYIIFITTITLIILSLTTKLKLNKVDKVY